MLEELIGPFYILFRGICRLLVRAHQIRCQQGLRAALKISGSYLAAGIRHNLERLPRLAMYLLPMAAAGAMWVVVSTVVQRPYALAVQVNGETVGYVANEDVFNSARDAVQQRINYAGTEKTEWTIEPAYTVGVAHDVMDENSMADAILRTSDDQISEGTALYLDGQLTAVCEEGVQLQSFLSSLLAPYEQEDDPNVTVGFNHSIELENGIYFNESFQDYNQVKELLTKVQQQQKLYKVLTGDTLWEIAQKNNLTMKELCALNPNFKGAPLSQDSSIMPGDELVITKEESLLEVQITKTVTWKEEIPYAIEKTKSNEYTVGTTKTLQEGQNGLRAVTAQNIYDTDGMLLEQTILGSETLQEPVTKKVVVGTKKITNKTTFITGSGQFIWPVPRGIAIARAGLAAATEAWISAPVPVPPFMLRQGARWQRPVITVQAQAATMAILLSSITQAATRLCTPTACPWSLVRDKPSNRGSSLAMWAAPANPAATIVTLRSGPAISTSRLRMCSTAVVTATGKDHYTI